MVAILRVFADDSGTLFVLLFTTTLENYDSSTLPLYVQDGVVEGEESKVSAWNLQH